MNNMIPGQGLGILFVRITDQRSDATPGWQHIGPSHLHVRIQIVLYLIDYKVDVFLAWRRVVGDGARRVGSARQSVFLPGQKKDDAAVRRVRVQQAHILRAVVIGQDNVNARARLTNLFRGRVVHLTYRVGVGSGGVHHALGLDLKRLACVAVNAFGACHCLVACLVGRVDQFGDCHMIGNVGTLN